MASRLLLPGLGQLDVKHGLDTELAHKTGGFELKELDEDGTFEGYASIFGVVDDGADIVAKGAFKRSLKERPAKAVKMLYQHNPDQPIGVYTEMKEDDKGLWVKGKLVREAAKGAECYALMKAGALDGMSIGYRTIRAERDERTGVRTLKELELWEVSIVTFPMLAVARVSGVKKDWSERLVERYLREAGMPNEFAKNVVLHGFKRASEMSGHPRDEGKGLQELLDGIRRAQQQIEGS